MYAYRPKHFVLFKQTDRKNKFFMIGSAIISSRLKYTEEGESDRFYKSTKLGKGGGTFFFANILH